VKCASSWLCLRNYVTMMHGQQDKFKKKLFAYFKMSFQVFLIQDNLLDISSKWAATAKLKGLGTDRDTNLRGGIIHHWNNRKCSFIHSFYFPYNRIQVEYQGCGNCHSCCDNIRITEVECFNTIIVQWLQSS
jgi:hypothetical protein